MHMRCRWSKVAAGHTEIQLELLPMLLGFFTYKAGVIAKQFTELMAEAARPGRAPGSIPGELHAMPVLVESPASSSTHCMPLHACKTHVAHKK